jgi:hypothetical protein
MVAVPVEAKAPEVFFLDAVPGLPAVRIPVPWHHACSFVSRAFAAIP